MSLFSGRGSGLAGGGAGGAERAAEEEQEEIVYAEAMRMEDEQEDQGDQEGRDGSDAVKAHKGLRASTSGKPRRSDQRLTPEEMYGLLRELRQPNGFPPEFKPVKLDRQQEAVVREWVDHTILPPVLGSVIAGVFPGMVLGLIHSTGFFRIFHSMGLAGPALKQAAVQSSTRAVMRMGLASSVYLGAQALIQRVFYIGRKTTSAPPAAKDIGELLPKNLSDRELLMQTEWIRQRVIRSSSDFGNDFVISNMAAAAVAGTLYGMHHFKYTNVQAWKVSAARFGAPAFMLVGAINLVSSVLLKSAAP